MSETSRRWFVTGLAAVWGLPWPTQLRAFLPDYTAEEAEESTGTRPDEFPRVSRHDGFSGTLVAREHADDVTVEIATYPYQATIPVGLELGSDTLTWGTAFEPEDARELAADLLAAADEVEAYRSGRSGDWGGPDA